MSSTPAPTDALPRIRLLPTEVQSRIAAGEVVERPSSAVKELVENSLDAAARSVEVELAGGGRDLLCVRDDGHGMSREELLLAVQRHATSKLRDAAELTRLATFGFRGEALPAIASVARVTLTSRTPDSEHAWRVAIEGGEVAQPEPAAAAVGSSVEVRDLFFNLPVRRKFLKSPGSEAAACADTVLRLALVRPDVAFKLVQGRQVLLDVPAWRFDSAPQRPAASAGLLWTSTALTLPLEAYLQRARALLGAAFTDPLAPCAITRETPAGSWRLFGLLAPPAAARHTRANLYLAVNGRAVKDRAFVHAVTAAYRTLLPPKRYPAAVLFLEGPGESIDINVHPAKTEVRFRESDLLYSLLHQAVRETFAAPTAETSAPPAAPDPAPTWALETPAVQTRIDLQPPAPAVRAYPGPDSDAPAPRAAEAPPETRFAAPKTVPSDAAARIEPARPVALPPSEPPPSAAATYRVIGQAGGMYLVVEDDEGIKLIDQHALHERILFEQLMARARRSEPLAQRLLIPESVELSVTQAAAWSDPASRAALAELGFELEDFGPRAVALQAVPLGLPARHLGALLGEILDALAALADEHRGQPLDRTILREKAAYVCSCKGALKAGERLNQAQLEGLLAEFVRVVGGKGFTCPHGRPLAVEISWADLERQVGR
ncbi:MAG: DNA mismatch repair endonuclease MutL [Planctomycetes bacterium]|nr:DNA mismatch repair endonuclease MutL [Planctomycetota bacterium]